MSSLPLLKLPLLVQKTIVHQWDLKTVFYLSILSEKAKNHLKECNLKVDKFSVSIHEAFFADRSIIALESLKDSLIINILDGLYLRVGKLVMTENFKIISRRGLKYEHQSVESIIKLLEKLTKHLLSFLKVRSFELQFGGDIDVVNFFLWKYSLKFDSITIVSRNWPPVNLTADKFMFILENVTTDYLELNVAVIEHSDFKYPTTTTHQKPLKIQKIKIRNDNHDWIDINKFVLMDFVSIDLSFSSATVQELNSILKSWLSGTSKKLEEFKLYAYRFPELQQDSIFAGIKATPTVFTDKELKNRYSNVEDAIKMDIERENNGLRATAILHNFNFVMLVWNDAQLKAIGRL